MNELTHLKTKLSFTLYIFILSAISAHYLFGAISFNQHSVFSSFYSEECIDITLESDFNRLIENKKTNNYQDAWITYTTIEGEKIKRLIKIRPRGRSRKFICDIPPIKLNFSRGNAEAINIMEDKSLKLVTHCFNGNTTREEQNILKEYLSYKLLNIITKKSFRVQLVKITYLDAVEQTSYQRLGFIIEGNNELANHLDAIEIKKINMAITPLEKDHYNTVALFQYMIGNTDWQIDILHNVKAFVSRSSGEAIVIPYDFDYSGFVNTNYSMGNPKYDQEYVTQRIFLGKVYDEKALNKTLNLFLSKKEEILTYCEKLTCLNNKNRQKVQKFIKSFYKQIENKKFAKSVLLKPIPLSKS